VGGQDLAIICYGRDSASGTRAFIHETVLDEEDCAPNVQPMPGTAAMVNAVAQDRGAIGFGGIAYAGGIKYAAVSGEEGKPFVMPSGETVADGSYPLSRYLNWYVLEGACGGVQDFIKWALGTEGQKVVEDVGYFPVEMK